MKRQQIRWDGVVRPRCNTCGAPWARPECTDWCRRLRSGETYLNLGASHVPWCYCWQCTAARRKAS